MGGHIWVESEPGGGSTFGFTARFCVQPDLAEDQSSASPPDLKGLRVLVVDDTDMNRRVLREILVELGASVTDAGDGEQGLDELRRGQETGLPVQLMLLDCRMPDMDGFEMMRRRKSQLGLGCPTVMMVTSDRKRDDLVRSLGLGIQSHIVKPITRRNLLEAIATALGQTPEAETLTSPAT